MHTDDKTALDAALIRLATRVYESPDLRSTLAYVAEGAAETLPEVDHASISVGDSPGGIETLAGTDPLVWELDAIQYAVGNGPCVYAITNEAGDTTVTVNFAHSDPRWPEFFEPAVERGVRSQLGLRLSHQQAVLGGLNLYSTTSDRISPSTVEMSQVYADQASLVLRQALEQDELVATLASRQLIGKATGLLMERHSLDDSQAYAFLLRISSLAHIGIQDFARELVDAQNEQHKPA